MRSVKHGKAGDFIFRSALEFLKKKKPMTEEEYNRISDRAKAKAFTVAGYTKAEVLDRFLLELQRACEEGVTKAEFERRMEDFLSQEGFETLNPYRADVIFRTNIQTAFNSGHYKSMTDKTTLRMRPYWQYKTAGDNRVRDEHRIMADRVYPATHPIWDTWYPPNGYRCRCSVVSLTEEQVKKRGLTVYEKAPKYVDYSTGEIKQYHPDKGFGHNPAKEVWKPDTKTLSEKVRSIFLSKKKNMVSQEG